MNKRSVKTTDVNNNSSNSCNVKVKSKGTSGAVKVNDTSKKKTGNDSFFKEVFKSEDNLREAAIFLLGGNFDNVKVSNVRPVLFGNKENDLSFLCDNTLYTMVEAQSTNCANITFRILEYCTTGLLSTLNTSDEILYGSKKVSLPIPKLYTIRTGVESNYSKIEEVTYDMHLSDLYKTTDDLKYKGVDTMADLDLTLHIYDFRMHKDEVYRYIEHGELPARFQNYPGVMRDYAIVADCLTYLSGVESGKFEACKDVKDAPELIEMLKDRNIFVDLFNRKEVYDMVTTQFSQENLIRYEAREEGRAEGRAEGEAVGEIKGIKKGFLNAIVTMLKNGGSEEQAKQFLHATPEQIEKAKSICMMM